MGKYLVILFGVSLVALGFPSAFEEYRRRIAAEGGTERLEEPVPIVEAALPARVPPGTATLAAGPDGHFRTQARLNGRAMDVLVDTGATYVAMNEATARRLGLAIAPAAFRYETETANGRAKVAVATLDRVQIGAVDVRGVEAVVVKGEGLKSVLLGMSFLKKLKRYDVENGRLNLVR